MDVLKQLGCCPEILGFGRHDGGDKVDVSVLARTTARTNTQQITAKLFEVPGVSDVAWG
jgi:hypothetical protein